MAFILLSACLLCIVLSTEYTVTTQYQYNGITISCPADEDCTLNCYETWSCYNSTIVGPSRASLTINCNNKNGQGMTCEYMTIYAQNSTKLNLNIYGYQGGAQVDMREANIYTPLVVSSSYSPNTIIKCGLIDPTNPHEAYPELCSYIVNIFSQNGWSSVSWSYLDDRWWALTLEDEDVLESTMFCGINYQHSCKGWKVDGIYYRCIDSQSACDYYRNDTYTFSPTLPSAVPSSVPSVPPTQYDPSTELKPTEYTVTTQKKYNGITITCPKDADCTLNCYETWSCYNLTIVGPVRASLTINCNNKNGQGMTCESMTILAQNSTDLNINIYGYQGGAQVDMREANIYTPLTVSSSYSPNTIIKCGLIDPTNPHEAYPERCSYIVNIFSQNGWSSVSWSYLDDRRWALTLEDEDVLDATMFCGVQYQHSCNGWKVDGIYYRCIDSQSACDYYRNDTYTFSPTLPTTEPSSVPSELPTQYDPTTELKPTEYTVTTQKKYNGITITCPGDRDCALNCYETWSCYNLTIVGPVGATLTINCNNKNGQGMTCESMTILAQNSTNLNINIYGYQGGAQVDMREANIYTPLVVSSSYSPNTIIKCGLIDPTNPHEAYPERCSYIVNIFSKNGWESVSWSYVEDRRWALTLEDEDVVDATMFCGVHYEHSCNGWTVDGIYYRCIDTQSICDYHRNGTLPPTPAPSRFVQSQLTTLHDSTTTQMFVDDNADSVESSLSIHDGGMTILLIITVFRIVECALCL